MSHLRRFALPCVCLALVAATTLHGAESSKESINRLANALQADGELWLKGQEVPAALDYQLRAVAVTDDNVNLLTDAINTPRKDPLNLYVANRLMKPLLRAKGEVIAKAVPAIMQFRLKAGDYKEPPVYSQDELRAMTQPTPAEATSRRLATSAASGPALTIAQKKKLEHDRPIIYHNQQLYEFEKAYFRLLILANSHKYDQEVIDSLRQTHDKGLVTFFDIVEAISDEAGKMSRERASWYHKELLGLLESLRLQKKEYSQPGNVQLSAEENSKVPMLEGYPGIPLAKAANLLASQSGLPARRVPTSQEVDAGKMKDRPSGGPLPRSTRPGI